MKYMMEDGAPKLSKKLSISSCFVHNFVYDMQNAVFKQWRSK